MFLYVCDAGVTILNFFTSGMSKREAEKKDTRKEKNNGGKKVTSNFQISMVFKVNIF